MSISCFLVLHKSVITDVWQGSKFASDHSTVTFSTQNSLQKLFFLQNYNKDEDMRDDFTFLIRHTVGHEISRQGKTIEHINRKDYVKKNVGRSRTIQGVLGPSRFDNLFASLLSVESSLPKFTPRFCIILPPGNYMFKVSNKNIRRRCEYVQS